MANIVKGSWFREKEQNPAQSLILKATLKAQFEVQQYKPWNTKNRGEIDKLTVGDINAPKYSVSKNVNSNFPGRNRIAPYISEPINSADTVVPTMANVKIAPKFRKKYFCHSKMKEISFKENSHHHFLCVSVKLRV